MHKTVIASFPRVSNAEDALKHLNDQGFTNRDIGVIAREGVIEHTNLEDTNDAVSKAAQGAASGATTGGIIGGITGLLMGIGAIVIPGLGALMIGGTLAAALGLTGAAAVTATGAATGALAGGLIGALAGLGVSEDVSKKYEEVIKDGGIVLAISTHTDGATNEVEDVVRNAGGDNVVIVDNEW